MKNWTDNRAGLWLDFVVLSVITISVLAIVSLVLGVFDPKVVYFSGVAIAVPLFIFSSYRMGGISDVSGPTLAGITVVILFSLVFRAEPFPWINGGQDQGVYVSMSSYYQNGGEVFISDNVLPHLEDGNLKKIYIESRRRGEAFHPGAYYGGDKDYVFQFYHLHPLWMAIFADFFGDDARGYSLTFFSLLSVVFLTLLAFELSGSRLAALSVGLLIALNPLHVFFSKWPVTEVVALAFSSIGFYYLARAFRLSAATTHARCALLVACLGLSLLFFVRITGFLYLPALSLVFLVGVWQYKTRGSRFGADLAFFAASCVTLYVISVFYGIKYSPNYVYDIYRATFGKLAGGQWVLVMAGLLLAMLIAMFAWYRLLDHPGFVSRVRPWIQSRVLILASLFIIIAAAIFSLFKVYRLGFSSAYGNDAWLGTRWGLSGTGEEAVLRSSVLNWLIYSSPLLVILGAIAIGRWKNNIGLALILFTWTTAFAVFVVANPALPYQYYYARYLVSEAVPYGILAFVVALVANPVPGWRRVGIVTVALTIPLFGYYTVKQFGAEEGVRPLRVLRKVASHVGDGDVLLIEPADWSIPRFGVETPLRFYFGLKTFALPADERKIVLGKVAGAFRNVWLLSPRPVVDERFVLEERLLHYDKVVERSGYVPARIEENFWRQELFLYSMKKHGYPSSRGEPFRFEMGSYAVGFDLVEAGFILGEGWHRMERAHVWSSGNASIQLDGERFPNNVIPGVIKLEIAPFGASQARPVKLEIRGCGIRSDFDYADGGRTLITLPIVQSGDRQFCKLDFTVANAASPMELGHSSDARVLGIALYSFAFER